MGKSLDTRQKSFLMRNLISVYTFDFWPNFLNI